jgi:hypothetical protein
MEQHFFARLQNHPVMLTLTVSATILAIPPALAWYGQISIALLFLLLGVLVLASVSAIGYSIAHKRALQPAIASTAPRTLAHIPDSADVLIPPDPCTSQPFYLEAFEKMAEGDFNPRSGWRYKGVGQEVIDWINLQYQRYVDAYPGARGRLLRQQFAELAFRWIKGGRLLSAQAAMVMIPEIERYVAARVARTTS